MAEKFEVDADTSKARRALKQLGDTAGRISGEMDEAISGKLVKSLAAGAIAVKAMDLAFRAVSGVISDIIEDSAELEKSTLALKAALRGQGLEVENNTRLLDRQSAALQRQAGMSDEAIRRIQALAINMGVGTERVDDFVRASIAMSNTVGIDVNSAMRQLTKSLSGLAGELGEIIPGVRELTAEQLKSGEVVELVNKAWGENLTLLAEGYTGKLNLLGLAWHDLAEEIGTSVTQSELFNDSIVFLTKLLDGIRKHGLISVVNPEELQREEEARVAKELADRDRAQSFRDFGAGPGGKPATTAPAAGKIKGGPRVSGDFDFLSPGSERTAFLVEQRQLQSEAQIQAEIEAFDQMVELTISNAKDSQEILDNSNAISLRAMEEQAAAELQIEQDKQDSVAAMRQRGLDIAGIIVNQLVATSLGALESLVAGEEVSGKKVLAEIMKGLGGKLVALGTADGFTAVSRLINSRGSDGWDLLAASVAEGAAGLGLIAGGSSLAKASIPSNSRGSGAGDFGSSAAFGSGGFAGGDGTPGFQKTQTTPNRSSTDTVVQFVIIGELDSQHVEIINRGMEKHRGAGF